MKKMAPYLILLPIMVTACSSPETAQQKEELALPKPGTEILSVSEPIAEDKLNHQAFSVKVIADSDIASGVYDVDMAYGYNNGQGKFTMPRGAERFPIVIRKGSQPYTYIIGFHMPDDTTFYDYFEVSSTSSGGNMRYLKAYTF